MQPNQATKNLKSLTPSFSVEEGNSGMTGHICIMAPEPSPSFASPQALSSINTQTQHLSSQGKAAGSWSQLFWAQEDRSHWAEWDLLA